MTIYRNKSFQRFLTVLFVLGGIFHTSVGQGRCDNKFDAVWPTPHFSVQSKCVHHADPAAREWKGINGNGIYDNCILYKGVGLRSGPRDPESKNFDLLEHLDISTSQLERSLSINPSRHFERVTSYIYNDNFPQAFTPDWKGPETESPVYKIPKAKADKPRFPDKGAPNPYFVEVSGISIRGELLHNWLHFRVFMNHSVGDPIRENLHTNNERKHNAKGKITAMLMMIKDQDGFPIGDFNQELPCSKTCYQYPHDVYYGDRRNAYPCSYTPPRATSHPGMFVYDADPGFYKRPSEDFLKNPMNKGPTGRQTVGGVNEKMRVKEGVREVHATWSFNQDTCNFVTEIHIYTMIFEDICEEDKQCTDGPKTDPNDDCRYYAWPAVYNILYPKGKESLGAADYVNIDYWKQRDKRTNEIDCHVPLFDALKTADSPFTKGVVPSNKLDSNGKVIGVVKVPRQYHHLGRLDEILLGTTGTTGTYAGVSFEYLGQYLDIEPVCRSPRLLNTDPVAEKNLKSLTDRNVKTGTPTVKQFLDSNEGVQCPCPAVASPEPLEQRTADPARLHGRLIHASHMALAYMFLAPLACFVARYYKETFITVFCFQEYWWFMWHVVLLVTACGFSMGAILSLYRGEIQEIAVDTNLLVHKILGYCSICVFYIEIFTGFFRRADPVKRIHQIFFHWLIGNFNIFCAVASMFAMAFVKQSGMTCNVVYTLLVWTLFVTVWFVLMDIHMKSSDKKLDLRPPRSYLPPPVVRLFNRDAPGRNFRMMMLAAYIINLGLIQYMVSTFIWESLDENAKGEKEESCYFVWLKWWGGGGVTVISEDDLAGDDDDLGDY